MGRPLPPLNALRAFEAAGRHLSFTRAAAELHVTQAAVSHQVRQLEDHLGTKLFRRLTRRIALTDAGAALLPVVADAFDRVAEAAVRVGRSRTDRQLTVSTTPVMGPRWLATRLHRFWSAHPDVELRLHHSIELVDFDLDGVDIAIRYGAGPWPGLTHEPLMAVEIAPVCAPSLLQGDTPLRRPEDLAQVTLLHEQDHQDWVQWLAAAHVSGVDGRRGPIVPDPTTLDQLVLSGAGVALGRLNLIRDHLAAGRMVQPFADTAQTWFAYNIVYKPGALERTIVKDFRDFLMAEAAADRDALPTASGSEPPVASLAGGSSEGR